MGSVRGLTFFPRLLDSPLLFPVRWSPDKKNAYLGSLKLSETTRSGALRWRYTHRMDHLACFLPGLLTLAHARWPKGFSAKRSSFAQRASPKTNLVGANQPSISFSQGVTLDSQGGTTSPQQPEPGGTRSDPSHDASSEDQPDPEWLRLAGGLMRTCVAMYTHAKSGLAPEYMNFDAEHDRLTMPSRGDAPGFINILRPETLESLYGVSGERGVFPRRRCERGVFPRRRIFSADGVSGECSLEDHYRASCIHQVT